MIDIQKMKQAALEALDDMDDYARMAVSIEPIGALNHLTDFINTVCARLEAAEEMQELYASSAFNTNYWKAKAEAAERDAERYRWLRTNPDWETYRLGTPIVFVTCNEEALPAQEGELDIAVDAAMKESK